MSKRSCTNLLVATLAVCLLDGCTVYGVKNPPTLKSTTSAEQYERLYWAAVKAKQWSQVPGLLAANVVYSAGGKQMVKEQVVPYLQSLNLADYTVTELTVKPNGPDMTLTYTLQLSTASGPNQTVNVISVWQQAAKGYILTAHVEQPST